MTRATPRPDRTELVAAVLLCLLAALLLVIATSRPWALVPVPGDALRPARDVPVDGSVVAPGVRALGLVGLAGVVAVAATRGRGRAVVGAVLALAGAAAALATLRAAAGLPGRVRDSGAVEGAPVVAVDPTGWPWLAALAGLLLLLAGLLVALRGPRWAALSARYDRAAPPAAASAPPPAADPAVGGARLWDSLDRGEDPTGRDPA